jgi:MFS family permease
MFQAVAVFGLATIGFGLSTSLWLSLLCLFILGAADMISVFVRQTLVQIDTPDGMRGRVAAVNAVFIGASNELGEFESGVLAAWIGTVPAVVLGGVGTLAVAALWARRFPELRQRDRLVE